MMLLWTTWGVGKGIKYDDVGEKTHDRSMEYINSYVAALFWFKRGGLILLQVIKTIL